MTYFSTILILLFISIIAFVETKKSNQLLNPVLVFCIWDLFLMFLLPICFLYLLEVFSLKAIESLINVFIALALGFYFGYKNNLFRPFFLKRLKIIFQNQSNKTIGNSRSSVNYKWVKFYLFLAALCCFLILINLGGGGLLWLTSPRDAYIGYRSGAGLFWLLYQWLLLFAQIVSLLASRTKTFSQVVAVSIFYMVLMYFSGSKGNILSVLVVSMVYWNFYIKKINFFVLFVIGVLFIVLFTILLGMQSVGFGDLIFSVVNYFSEYTSTAASYFEDEFLELGLGNYMLSSLWFYVPRELVPNKPYEYGVLLIHQQLFPGAAELGHTPGVPNWMLYYLDYSYVGVFLYGAIGGIFRRAFFDLFIANRRNPSIFLLYVHSCIFQIMALASPIVLISFAIVFRKIDFSNRFRV